MKISGPLIGTLVSAVHHLPAVALYTLASPVGNVGSSVLHILGFLSMRVTNREHFKDFLMKSNPVTFCEKIFRGISGLFISDNLDNICTCSPTSINVHMHVCVLIPGTHNRIYAQHTCAIPVTPDCKAIVWIGENIDTLEHHRSESITTFTQCTFRDFSFFLQHVTGCYFFWRDSPQWVITSS